MALVQLFTPPVFEGVITNTPSKMAYSVKPGQTVSVDERDVELLLGYGFTVAPSSSTVFNLQAAVDAAPTQSPIAPGGGIPITNAGTLYKTSPQSILNIGTIEAAGPTGTANGVIIQIKGGNRADGESVYAGAVYIAGGADITTVDTTGIAGYVWLQAGNSHYGKPGNVYLNAGNASGGDTHNAGNVYLNFGRTSNPAASNGRFYVGADPSVFEHPKSWFAGEMLNGRTIYTATRAEMVTAVIGRVDVANGAAATLVVVKCASGTAPGSGIALTSDSMNLAGTPATDQTLTLSTTHSDLMLAAGDSLVLVESGTLGTSVGCITVHSTPQ
jgi:hypothetical protein